MEKYRNHHSGMFGSTTTGRYTEFGYKVHSHINIQEHPVSCNYGIMTCCSLSNTVAQAVEKYWDLLKSHIVVMES